MTCEGKGILPKTSGGSRRFAVQSQLVLAHFSLSCPKDKNRPTQRRHIHNAVWIKVSEIGHVRVRICVRGSHFVAKLLLISKMSFCNTAQYLKTWFVVFLNPKFKIETELRLKFEKSSLYQNHFSFKFDFLMSTVRFGQIVKKWTTSITVCLHLLILRGNAIF